MTPPLALYVYLGIGLRSSYLRGTPLQKATSPGLTLVLQTAAGAVGIQRDDRVLA